MVETLALAKILIVSQQQEVMGQATSATTKKKNIKLSYNLMARTTMVHHARVDQQS